MSSDFVQPNLFLDINECLLVNNGGCSQTCTNTNGSFVCSCQNGFVLDSDNLTCQGKVEYMHVEIHHSKMSIFEKWIL